MTWTAPEVRRQIVPRSGDERTMLDGFLEFYRLTLLHKCAGLTAEQMAERSAEPSGLSLLGLIRHMAGVERVWFRGGFAEQKPGPIFWTEENLDADFEDAVEADAQVDLAAYQRELDLARETAAGRSLDDTFRSRNGDEDISLRWVYLHVIEEYARHSGHADLIRERIDGAKGE
jgi:uncharacterized damage-inducible protein DinB